MSHQRTEAFATTLQRQLCQFFYELSWQFGFVYKGTPHTRPKVFVAWYERW